MGSIQLKNSTKSILLHIVNSGVDLSNEISVKRAQRAFFMACLISFSLQKNFKIDI